MARLAALGGIATFETPVDGMAIWPPRDEVTARRLQEVYASGRWSAWDPGEAEFARDFAEYHDSAHGVFTINGTVTLHIALAALGVGPGDEVIVPPLTWYATAMAVLYVGAIPVFVDIDPQSLCLDPAKFEAAITSRTRAVIPVHAYGAFADMDRIMAIAARRDIAVVEDAAHMHGGIWDGRKAGSLGHVGSFSFQASKTMSSGEGGISITNDDALFDRMFRVKQIGFGPDEIPRKNWTGPPEGLLAYNFRATAFHPVILAEQLRTLGDRLVRYNRAVGYLEQRLSESTRIRFQRRDPKTDLQGYFEWIPIFDDPEFDGIPAGVIVRALQAEGLSVLEMDGPMYDFVLFNAPNDAYRIPEPCTVTEAMSARALGMHHALLGLPDVDLEKIGDALEKVATDVDGLRELARLVPVSA